MIPSPFVVYRKTPSGALLLVRPAIVGVVDSVDYIIVMALRLFPIWLILYSLYHRSSKADIVFEETPHVVRIHPGEQATFSWKIDTSLDSVTYGIVSFNYGNLVPDFYQNTLQDESSTWNHGYGNRANVSFTDNNQRLAFTLRETGEPDTIHNYECEVYNALTGGLDTDTDARLFIYGIPNTPTITPSQPSPPENTRFTLTCSATSTSVPDDSSIRPAMTYTWTMDNGPLPGDRHTASEGDLTISPVHKDDSLVTYTCTAQETGSRLSTGAGVQLDVQYTPGQPTLSVTPNPALEGSSLRLDCTLSDDQQGNPRVYSFRWWNTDHGGNYTRTTGSLNIDSATVAEHDGLWRCVVSNAVGPGVYGQIHVTVNSASEMTKAPSEQRSLLYSDNLAELCEVRAKPAASVTWFYNGGPLPDGVRTQSDSEQSGKYTISRSTLQWNPEASDDQRRRAGGRFTCHGVNVIGNVSASMDLTVLYGPLNIELSDSGPITAVEGEPVSVNCSSDCSPSCTFTWTRSTLPTWSSPGPTLTFHPVRRDHHDSYICQAENGLENEKTAQVDINVHFGPDVTSFSSSPADVLHGDPATLVCRVSSRPNSTITINSSSNVLRSSFDQQAEYHLESASILDSGVFRCTADNYISSDIKDHVFDVAGGFNLCENQENTESRGIALRATFEERICQFANPFPNVTRDNWMFESANLTGIDTVLPDDIVIGMNTTEHQYKKIIVFHIPQTSASHYGNYTLTTKNQYGSELIYTLILTPDGPPEPPYDLRCTRVTAVSLYIEWTAGYHGGSEQRFVIIYTNTNTGDVNTVETDNTEYRLAENEQILPAQTYRIQVNAVNDNGVTAGPTVINTTLAQPEFEGNPSIDIQGDTAYITWAIVNVESVTRISVDACGPQKDTNCIATNITDLSTTPYVVKVPDVDTIHFNFTFYDVQDIVHHQGYTFSAESSTTIVIAIAVTLTVVVVIALVVLLVLWRKGLLPNQEKPERPVSNLLTAPDRLGRETHDTPVSTPADFDLGLSPYSISPQNNRAETIPDDISPYGETPATRIHPNRNRHDGIHPNSASSQTNNNRTGDSKDVYADVKKDKPPVADVYSEVKKDGQKPALSAKPAAEGSQGRPVSVYPPAKAPKPTVQPEPAIYSDIKKDRKPKGQNATRKSDKTDNANAPNGKPQISSRKMESPYTNVGPSKGPDGSYSEVCIPGIALTVNEFGAYQNISELQAAADLLDDTPFVGDDGITYARLDMTVKAQADARAAAARGIPPPRPVIRGEENKTEYASIDQVKTRQQNKR